MDGPSDGGQSMTPERPSPFPGRAELNAYTDVIQAAKAEITNQEGQIAWACKMVSDRELWRAGYTSLEEWRGTLEIDDLDAIEGRAEATLKHIASSAATVRNYWHVEIEAFHVAPSKNLASLLARLARRCPDLQQAQAAIQRHKTVRAGPLATLKPKDVQLAADEYPEPVRRSTQAKRGGTSTAKGSNKKRRGDNGSTDDEDDRSTSVEMGRTAISPLNDDFSAAFDFGGGELSFSPSAYNSSDFHFNINPTTTDNASVLYATSHSTPHNTQAVIQCLKPGHRLTGDAIDKILESTPSRACRVFPAVYFDPAWLDTPREPPRINADVCTVLVPIHHAAPEHWTLGRISLRRRIFQHYDSIQSTERDRTSVENLQQFAKWLTSKQQTRQCPNWRTEVVEWTPQQNNTYDCGLYVVRLIELINIGDDIPDEIDTVQLRELYITRIQKQGTLSSPYETENVDTIDIPASLSQNLASLILEMHNNLVSANCAVTNARSALTFHSHQVHEAVYLRFVLKETKDDLQEGERWLSKQKDSNRRNVTNLQELQASLNYLSPNASSSSQLSRDHVVLHALQDVDRRLKSRRIQLIQLERKTDELSRMKDRCQQCFMVASISFEHVKKQCEKAEAVLGKAERDAAIFRERLVEVRDMAKRWGAQDQRS